MGFVTVFWPLTMTGGGGLVGYGNLLLTLLDD
jgi:hypothetical protein